MLIRTCKHVLLHFASASEIALIRLLGKARYELLSVTTERVYCTRTAADWQSSNGKGDALKCVWE
jgi:hypothetical protein